MVPSVSKLARFHCIQHTNAQVFVGRVQSTALVYTKLLTTLLLLVTLPACSCKPIHCGVQYAVTQGISMILAVELHVLR